MINPTYEYDCVVVQIVDGDTLDVSADLGFSISLAERARVYGLNCREIHSTDIEEKRLGLADKAFAEGLLPSGTHAKMRSHKIDDPREKFGRWLCEIELPNGKDFAAEMIAAGHGIAYFGGRR